MKRLKAALAITRCGHTLSSLSPSLSLSLTLSLQFGAMSYQKWSRESREMPALLRSLEQFINNVSECVSECICSTHALDECRAVFIQYLRYAKTYLYPHNSVCGLPYEKENRNGITIAFASLSSLSFCLFGFWFSFLLSSFIFHLPSHTLHIACHKVCLRCHKCLMKALQMQ